MRMAGLFTAAVLATNREQVWNSISHKMRNESCPAKLDFYGLSRTKFADDQGASNVIKRTRCGEALGEKYPE
jgi:hypothetical protein